MNDCLLGFQIRWNWRHHKRIIITNNAQTQKSRQWWTPRRNVYMIIIVFFLFFILFHWWILVVSINTVDSCTNEFVHFLRNFIQWQQQQATRSNQCVAACAPMNIRWSTIVWCATSRRTRRPPNSTFYWNFAPLWRKILVLFIMIYCRSIWRRNRRRRRRRRRRRIRTKRLF